MHLTRTDIYIHIHTCILRIYGAVYKWSRIICNITFDSNDENQFQFFLRYTFVYALPGVPTTQACCNRFRYILAIVPPLGKTLVVVEILEKISWRVNRSDAINGRVTINNYRVLFSWHYNIRVH